MRSVAVLSLVWLLAIPAHAAPPSVVKAARQMYGAKARVGRAVDVRQGRRGLRLYTISVAGVRQPNGLVLYRNNRLNRVVVFEPDAPRGKSYAPRSAVRGVTDTKGIAVLLPRRGRLFAENDFNLRPAGEGATRRHRVMLFKPDPRSWDRNPGDVPHNGTSLTVRDRNNLAKYWTTFVE